MHRHRNRCAAQKGTVRLRVRVCRG
ncbi:hypothetical protein CSHISOI_04912 [Colletotrichum shisoi]|uniref:Uncharacterized protein n=1 Tax=Colletotrichum shisoi TaxID=2078593 RepID=A0A5Q4BSA4_9PEZI|nr:hypothetical protein CSHISOI_04912 [Colletotrichum shisoi]